MNSRERATTRTHSARPWSLATTHTHTLRRSLFILNTRAKKFRLVVEETFFAINFQPESISQQLARISTRFFVVYAQNSIHWSRTHTHKKFAYFSIGARALKIWPWNCARAPKVKAWKYLFWCGHTHKIFFSLVHKKLQLVFNAKKK